MARIDPPDVDDAVAYEINGQPRLYEGVVLATSPTAMTVLLDTGRRMAVRYASIDGLTITHAA